VLELAALVDIVVVKCIMARGYFSKIINVDNFTFTIELVTILAFVFML